LREFFTVSSHFSGAKCLGENVKIPVAIPKVRWYVELWIGMIVCGHIISSYAGPDLGVVRPQATVIPGGAPIATYPNYIYINHFIKLLLNAFRVIVILQPFFYFINLGDPLSPGAPKHCFFCFYLNPPLIIRVQYKCGTRGGGVVKNVYCIK